MNNHTEITTQMSERPVGGMMGIEVTTEQQTEFAKFMGVKYIDQYMPLPGVMNEEQKKIHCEDHNAREGYEKGPIYWENEEGSHGWCCGTCGEVIQWG